MAAMMQQEKESPGLLARYVPILHWLPRYDKAWLSGDIVAGLSVWALMVPQCLGFAAICGVPAQADFGTVPQKFLFRFNWPLFRPAAPLV